MKKIIIFGFIILCLNLMGEELTLDTAWTKVLTSNLQVRSEELTIKSKGADVKLALNNMLPSGSASGSYSRSGDELESDKMGFHISVSQPVFQGGKLYLDYQDARKTQQQAEKSYQALLLSLRMQLEDKYYAALEKQENLQIAHQEIDYAQSNLEAAQIRFDNGNISSGELLQLRSQAAQQEVTILKAENSLRIALNDLGNFLAVKENIDLIPVSLADYQEIILELGNWQISSLEAREIDLIEYARTNNPEFLLNKLGVDISGDGVKSAKANFLPSISMSLSKSWNYSDWDAAPDGSWSLGLSASLPVFSIVDNYLNYAKAQYSLTQTELSLDQKELDLELSIKSALLNLVATVQELKAVEIAREYAEESYQAAEERFRNNMITANELLNTQIALRTAESALTSATYAFLGYKGELQANLGILDEAEFWQLLINP